MRVALKRTHDVFFSPYQKGECAQWQARRQASRHPLNAIPKRAAQRLRLISPPARGFQRSRYAPSLSLARSLALARWGFREAFLCDLGAASPRRPILLNRISIKSFFSLRLIPPRAFPHCRRKGRARGGCIRTANPPPTPRMERNPTKKQTFAFF